MAVEQPLPALRLLTVASAAKPFIAILIPHVLSTSVARPLLA